MASADALALTYFRLFAVSIIVVALAGLGRVWLSAEAAAVSRESIELRESIRSERYEGDMLEVRESALGSPSRIRTIASKTMGMKPAGKVTYLDISEAPAPSQAASDRTGTAAQGSQTEQASKPASRTLARLIDVTAGEAQVLLVGDVALASSRK